MRIEHGVGNGFGLGHAPRADHAAGQVARAGFDHAHAALAQDFKVGLRRRMLPHVHVHRRSHQHRRACGQIHGGQKIVGNAVRKFGKDVGGGWSNDQAPQSTALRQCARCEDSYVASLLSESSHRLVITLWPVSAAKVSGCTKRVAASVITTCTSMPASLQGAHQFRRFVRRNAAGDADRYSHIYDCSPIRFDDVTMAACTTVLPIAFRPQRRNILETIEQLPNYRIGMPVSATSGFTIGSSFLT